MARSVLALLALLLAAPSHAGQKLVGPVQSVPRNAVTGGGTLATGGGYSLNSAVGETGVSSFTGSGFRLYSGLMHQIAQPGSVTAITAVTKATGTMVLAWSAPGMDGFLGNVSGFYRIDTSSDPAHVFDPTIFTTEFATTVVPGDAQAYVLDNLLPNTTYYTRVYLSDARKVVAENSTRSDESTLANVPVSPVLTDIGSSSATFTWTLPVGGAEGFETNASSTNYGTLFPGGVITSSRTNSGVVLTMTIHGLSSETTYYFKLGSLNWQSQLNFNTIIAARTLKSNLPLPIVNLMMVGNRLARKVLFSWTNQTYDNPAGVLVQVSTNPISVDPVNGTPYGEGAVLADGSVIKSSAAAASYLETGLVLDTTEYFRFYAKNTAHSYSVAVSTYIIMDLPPMTPAGLWSEMSNDRTHISLNWSGVTSNLDGSSFRSISAPHGWELAHYNVYRATNVVRSNWVLIGTTSINASSFVASVPDPSAVFYYKIVSKDLFADESDSSMVMDTLGNLYAMGADEVTRLKMPPSMAKTMLAGNNLYRKDMLVKATERPEDVGGKIVKSMEFSSMMTPSGFTAPMHFGDGTQMDVVLHYDVANNQVVAGNQISAAGARVADVLPAVNANEANMHLGAYWNNNQDFIKMFGHVDPHDQTIGLQSGELGIYQIRNVLRSNGFSFDLSGISNKVLTPNGDGFNDTVVFIFDNPADNAYSGQIFDMRGAYVADMAKGAISNTLTWNGKAAGVAVPRGIYLYQIKAETKTFNGTVVIIR